ncbi:MAG: FecR domain-containing protein [Breznakibacter sp.]
MESLNNENRWEKIAKHLAGESSSDEQAGIGADLNKDESFRHNFDNAAEAWDIATYAARYGSIDAEAAFINVKSKIGQNKSKNQVRLGFIWSAAAVLLVLVSVGVWMWGSLANLGQPPVALMSAQAIHDVRALTLADGSVVNLNKGSQLSYPEKFGTARRDVKLSGEAFFEVAPDKSSPFFIEAGDVTVRVVGTSFNVKAFPGSRLVEVTVGEGVVEVVGRSGKVVLTKGLKAVFDAATGLLEKSVNTDVNYDAWKTRKLVFKESPLAEVFNTLQNVYHLHFVAADPALLNGRLTASFNDKSADYVSEVVALTFNLKMEKTESAYIFSKETVPTNRH